MTFSRRELALIVPALSIAGASGEGQQKPDSAHEAAALAGKIYEVDTIPWRATASGVSKSRGVFNGFTTRGQHLTMHVTELAPGQRPHPAARQPHEEVLILQQGTIECTINGQTATLHPGDVVYSAYNDLKDWKNAGNGPAIYYVISLEEHQ